MKNLSSPKASSGGLTGSINQKQRGHVSHDDVTRRRRLAFSIPNGPVVDVIKLFWEEIGKV